MGQKNDILESNRISNRNKALENNIKADDIAIEINPQNSTAWIDKGFALEDLNKFDEALKAFDKAIEINPQYSEVRKKKNTLLKLIK